MPWPLTSVDSYNNSQKPRGDVDTHKILWESSKIDKRGKTIENIIKIENLYLFNNKSHTYLHPAMGTYLNIVLTLNDPALVLEYDWHIWDNIYGIDHFPIIIKNIRHPNSCWNLKKTV